LGFGRLFFRLSPAWFSASESNELAMGMVVEENGAFIAITHQII